MAKEITYYPHPKDMLWNAEVETLMRWFRGKGLDVGCSVRSIYPEDVRQDIDKEVEPQVLCSGDDMPFNDEEFDYVYSIHTFEHFKDQIKTITEWKRVCKTGGVIGIVHPDVSMTGVYRPRGLEEGENPYYKHEHERTHEQMLAWLKEHDYFGMKLIDDGVAGPGWSFYIILKKV